MATQAQPARPSRTEHAKELVARGRDRVERAVHDLEAARSHSGPVDIAFATAERDRRAGGQLLAGALAYRAFLWLLPAALTLVLVLGVASTSSGTDPAKVVDKSGLPGFAAASVAGAAKQDNRGRVLAIVASVILLWMASGALLKALRAVHAFAWGEELRKPPSALKSTGGFLLLALGTAVVLSGMSALRRSQPGPGLALLFAAVLVFTAAWWLGARHLPHADAPAIALLPGAFFLGMGIQAMHLVTVLYLGPKLASSSQLYGDLGGAAVLLLGMFILSRLIVASAMLNATLWTRYKARHPAAHP